MSWWEREMVVIGGVKTWQQDLISTQVTHGRSCVCEKNPEMGALLYVSFRPAPVDPFAQESRGGLQLRIGTALDRSSLTPMIHLLQNHSILSLAFNRASRRSALQAGMPPARLSCICYPVDPRDARPERKTKDRPI